MNHKAEPSNACLSGPAAEEMLVFAARHGDEKAFETLFERYQQKVLRVVMRYTRVREDAEDIVQQSFQKAFMHLCKFKGRSSFSTWLTRIAINEALMFLRSLGAMRELSVDELIEREATSSRLEIPDSSPDPETSCIRQEGVQILSNAIGNLRPGMQKAIKLRELAELSTSETARRMGLSVAAVKGRIFHGKRKLRKILTGSMASDWSLKRSISSPHSGRGTSLKIYSPQAHAVRASEERGHL
jgi:RNA polymerase sigma-70 factor (ECF subfamily)